MATSPATTRDQYLATAENARDNIREIQAVDLLIEHPVAGALSMQERRPRRIFVNAQSDLFHKNVPDEFIARVWAVMALAEQHTFQVLTKRHGRMRSLLSSPDFEEAVGWAATGLSPYWTRDQMTWPLPNVWLGVSVEDQARAEMRIDTLRKTPAAVRWLSCEPLLGPVCLDSFHSDDGHNPGEWAPCEAWPPGIDWVVVGGESGPGSRPMHPDWARQLRDQCVAAGIPFLFKQWGEHDALGQRVGKGRAGRELDGRTWDEYPEAVSRG